MVRYFSRAFLFLLAAALIAGPAAAELYTLHLKNGTLISSRQQPQYATWDKNIILVLTDVGNWSAIEAAEVEKVETETQVRGFALRLNANTIFLGWSANDGRGDKGGVILPPEARNYDQQQFVDPSQAGGGFPTLGGNFPGSGGDVTGGGFVPPEAPSAPTTPAPAEASGQQ